MGQMLTERTPERGQEDLLSRQRRRESSARSYPRRLPVAPVWGRGALVRDAAGTEYVDCLAGAGALALGHSHPVVVEAVQQALASEVPWSTLDLPTPLKDAFVDELFATLPPELAGGRIQFCGPTGADAVEATVKLVRTATGRSPLVAFGGSYHGMTAGSLALTGALGAKEPLGTLLPDVHHLPFPGSYRCPFGTPGPRSSELAAHTLRWALTDDHAGMTTPAGLFMEPVQGEGGVHPAPREFAQEVRRLTREAGVPLVFDEVQTGLGRTGTTWALEQLGVVPDVLVMSKAIGGGMPLAVVVYREDLDGWKPGAHAGTFRGHQLALAAGAATIREVVASELPAQAALRGAQLVAGLRTAAAGRDEVGDVRGRGLMVGVELVDPDVLDAHGVPRPDGELARAVQHELLGLGVIAEVGGREGAVLRFLPPLIVDAELVDRVAMAFGAALHLALTQRPAA